MVACYYLFSACTINIHIMHHLNTYVLDDGTIEQSIGMKLCIVVRVDCNPLELISVGMIVTNGLTLNMDLASYLVHAHDADCKL